MATTGKNIRLTILAAAAVLAAWGCQARAQDKPLADTSRLVSIGGAVTEIVFALGQGEKVVGRDTTSVYPQEAFALPDVGYMRALSPEGVLSINPTAILMIEGSGPQDAIEVLKKATVPVVTIPEGYDRDGIVRKIKAVGAALGQDGRAAELADKVAADIDAAHAVVAGIAEDKRKRVLFVLSLRNGKVMAAGRNTSADGILRLAGAVNATPEFEGFKAVNDEAIIGARPDVILMMSQGGPMMATDQEIFANPAIALTPAGRNKALLRLDSLTLLGFGPRTADAVRSLATSLYGG
jgi:iron complex transport system substrate-binding protein